MKQAMTPWRYLMKRHRVPGWIACKNHTTTSYTTTAQITPMLS
jgi:hypothetical protein